MASRRDLFTSILSDKDTADSGRYHVKRQPEGEDVNFLGYYSTHEQNMAKSMAYLAQNTETHLRTMLSLAQSACRKEVLWNKLLTWRPGSPTSGLSTRS